MVHKFPQILDAIEKFYASEGWHEASFILRIQKHRPLGTKCSRHGDLTPRICATLAYVKEEASQDTRNRGAGINLFSRGRNGLVLAHNGDGDDENDNSKKKKKTKQWVNDQVVSTPVVPK